MRSFCRFFGLGLAALICFAAPSAFATDGPTYGYTEVGARVGGLESMSPIYVYNGDLIAEGSIDGAPAIEIEVTQRRDRWLSVGGILTGTRFESDIRQRVKTEDGYVEASGESLTGIIVDAQGVARFHALPPDSRFDAYVDLRAGLGYNQGVIECGGKPCKTAGSDGFALAYGFGLGATYRLDEGPWHANAGYTYANGRNISSNMTIADYSGSARHVFGLGLKYRFGG